MHRVLGPMEFAVLMAVQHLDQAAYGASVQQRLTDLSKRPYNVGAIYTALERLEAKGFLSSHWGQPRPQRGGRRRRFFRLTATGEEAILDTQVAYRVLMSPQQ